VKMTQEVVTENTVELLEGSPQPEFLPFWQVDEVQIEVAHRTFAEFASAKNLKVKSRISEYKVIDESGKEEIVKADCAQDAATTATLKNLRSITYLENSLPSFLDTEHLEV
jgi:hypothetical protein